MIYFNRSVFPITTAANIGKRTGKTLKDGAEVEKFREREKQDRRYVDERRENSERE